MKLVDLTHIGKFDIFCQCVEISTFSEVEKIDGQNERMDDENKVERIGEKWQEYQ